MACCATPAVALYLPQSERDTEHANAKKSVEMMVAFEEKEKRSRKECARMTQSLVCQRTAVQGGNAIGVKAVVAGSAGTLQPQNSLVQVYRILQMRTGSPDLRGGTRQYFRCAGPHLRVSFIGCTLAPGTKAWPICVSVLQLIASVAKFLDTSPVPSILHAVGAQSRNGPYLDKSCPMFFERKLKHTRDGALFMADDPPPPRTRVLHICIDFSHCLAFHPFSCHHNGPWGT